MEAMDNRHPSFRQKDTTTVQINIQRDQSAPVFNPVSDSTDIQETQGVNTEIYRVNAIDPDRRVNIVL